VVKREERQLRLKKLFEIKDVNITISGRGHCSVVAFMAGTVKSAARARRELDQQELMEVNHV